MGPDKPSKNSTANRRELSGVLRVVSAGATAIAVAGFSFVVLNSGSEKAADTVKTPVQSASALEVTKCDTSPYQSTSAMSPAILVVDTEAEAGTLRMALEVENELRKAVGEAPRLTWVVVGPSASELVALEQSLLMQPAGGGNAVVHLELPGVE